jgi:CubicO group peptidase (beta-lactamase class C family)
MMKNGGLKRGHPDKYLQLSLGEMSPLEKHDANTKKDWEAAGKKPDNWPKAGTKEISDFNKYGNDINKTIKEGFNGYEGCKAEGTSALTKASARGLAHFGAFFANGGSLGGKTIISEDTCTSMLSEPTLKVEVDGMLITNYTQGGLCKFEAFPEPKPKIKYSHELMEYVADEQNKNRLGYYGWYGMGGSIFQINPDKNISFAYVPCDLIGLDMVNSRNQDIQKKIVDIVSSME